MEARKKKIPDWAPYVVPYGAFLLLTWLGSVVPGAFALSFPVRAVIVAGLLVWFWRRGDYPELELRPSLLGIAAGLLGFVLWVGPEELLSFLPKLGESSYPPKDVPPDRFAALNAVRLASAVLVVPIFEELFLRSFLLRFLDATKEDREDFRSYPIGHRSLFSFVGVVVAMAVTHHRWLRAGLYSALLNLLLYRERRMGSVIWAHAVTNLALGIYVLETGRWTFW